MRKISGLITFYDLLSMLAVSVSYGTELALAGADFVFEDLSDTGLVIESIHRLNA